MRIWIGAENNLLVNTIEEKVGCEAVLFWIKKYR
jgi:hypothetical protein